MEFVLVGALLTVLTLAVIQFALAVYVRNVVHDAAVEGAYVAALADTDLDEGAAHTREAITVAVGAGYAEEVAVTVVDDLGQDTVQVTVRTRLPVIGLLGIAGMLEVAGRAPAESFDD